MEMREMQELFSAELELCKKAGGDAEMLANMGLDTSQLTEIRKGLEAGIDVSQFADPAIPWFEMEGRRLELEGKIDVSEYEGMDLDWRQMEEIRRGLSSGVDVSRYADQTFMASQMEEIRKGLESGIDVGCYADSGVPCARMRQLRKALEAGLRPEEFLRYDAKIIEQLRKAHEAGGSIKEAVIQYIEEGYDAGQLEEIRIALEEKIFVKKYLKKELIGEALRELRIGLEENLDISVYADTQYGWRQMREIRMGLEKQLDVSWYANPLYGWRQMRQIRKGLEDGLDVSKYARMMYAVSDMERLRKELLEHSGLQERLMEPEQKEEVWSGHKVTVSKDNMEAYLELMPPAGRKEYRIMDLLGQLRKEGVKLGIDRPAIENMLRKKTYGAAVLVARGKEPVDGEDGWYEYNFRVNLPTGPRMLEDGSVDYRHVEYFEQVSQGQVLAVYHKAEDGIPGYDITGNSIPSKRGKEKPILTGKGFLLMDDKKTYVAAIPGMIEIEEHRIKVTPLLVVKKVTLATGDIHFEGSVEVTGDVGNGATIEAKGDVVIGGTVEGAVIRSEKNILLKSGVLGNGQASIEAGGNITGKFFEAASVKADGSLQANYCLNCNMFIRGQVVIFGRKGRITGGMVRAVQGVSAFDIGNPAELMTVVNVGVDDALILQYRDLCKELMKIEEELKLLRDGEAKMRAKYDPQFLMSIDMYLKINQAIEMKEEGQREKWQRYKQMESEIENVKTAKVLVKGNAYPGSLVIIDGAFLPVRTHAKNVTFRFQDERVAAFLN